MDLVKEHWSKEHIAPFEKYLLTFSKGEEKGKWEQRIVNTKMPCIALPSEKVKEIVKEIYKGNYLEFLNLELSSNFTEMNINGGLICKITDFDLMKKYLHNYLLKVDNWANIDSLKFKITSKNRRNFFQLAQEYVKSDKTFVRRCGLIILFKLIDDEYIDNIFEIMNSLTNEQEYYVNMANAWLFAECFTKQREKTLKFLKTHNMNDFTINHGVQKCRDSLRISPEDKEMLLKYKRNKNGRKKE